MFDQSIFDRIQLNIQSSIRIEGSKIIYFDPWQIRYESHDADMIFITHEHYDHFSPEDIVRVANMSTYIVCPQMMLNQVMAAINMPYDRFVGINPGQKREIARMMVEGVWAYNQRKPFHAKRNAWLGYVVTLDAVRYYVAGDTDATSDNRDVRCNVAFLPIGGVNTMDIKEAAILTRKITPDAVIPTHYGSIVGSPLDGELFERMVPKGVECRLYL